MKNTLDTYPIAADACLFAIINDTLNVLVIRRGIQPNINQLALPGGFLRGRETTEETILREIFEETGVTEFLGHLEKLNWYDNPDRDPRHRVISLAYMGFVSPNVTLNATTDALDAEFLPVEQLLTEHPLAFDHNTILKDAVERARNRLEYTTLAVHLAGETFTIPQLRKVYETVWGVPLHKSNFQRKVEKTSGFIIPTGKTDESSSHQPGPKGMLYKAGDATVLHPPIQRGTV